MPRMRPAGKLHYLQRARLMFLLSTGLLLASIFVIASLPSFGLLVASGVSLIQSYRWLRFARQDDAAMLIKQVRSTMAAKKSSASELPQGKYTVRWRYQGLSQNYLGDILLRTQYIRGGLVEAEVSLKLSAAASDALGKMDPNLNQSVVVTWDGVSGPKGFNGFAARVGILVEVGLRLVKQSEQGAAQPSTTGGLR